MPKCRICGKEAVVHLPHSRLWLCKDHFNGFMVNRVFRTIKRYNLIKKGDRVVLGISGGKDSVVLAYILSKLKNMIDFELYLVHIKLGFGDYSEKIAKLVKNTAENISAPLIILDLREMLGIGIPELALKTRRPACSVCGIVKRYLLNAVAVELGTNSIATGHNLDDVATFILKEFLTQNLENISKLAPRNEGVEDYLVARIKPFYETYERDIKEYATLNNIEYVKENCPMANELTLTNNLKKALWSIEEKFPGLLIGFVRNFIKNLDKYPKPIGEIKRCSFCGMPSSGDKCSFCRLTEKAYGKPMSYKIREFIASLSKENY